MRCVHQFSVATSFPKMVQFRFHWDAAWVIMIKKNKRILFSIDSNIFHRKKLNRLMAFADLHSIQAVNCMQQKFHYLLIDVISAFIYHFSSSINSLALLWCWFRIFLLWVLNILTFPWTTWSVKVLFSVQICKCSKITFLYVSWV